MSTGTLSRKCERSKSLCLQAKKKKKKRCQLSSAHLWITAQPRVLPRRCASPSASHLPGKALRESVEGAGFCLPERLRRIKPSEEQTAAPPCSASAPRGRRLLSEEVFWQMWPQQPRPPVVLCLLRSLSYQKLFPNTSGGAGAAASGDPSGAFWGDGAALAWPQMCSR